MEKIKLKQAVIVEGKYDKARLAPMLDALILTTGGFNIFRDRQKLELIQRLARTDGVILLTDSDAAGFRIRSYLAGAVKPSQLTHVYTPDLSGKEPRKQKPGAEGKLGVEGIPNDLLRKAFEQAGVLESSRDQNAPPGRGGPSNEEKTPPSRAVSMTDLVEWGISGGENSFAKRQKVLAALQLPARLNVKALLNMINRTYSYEQFKHIVDDLQ